MTDMATKEKKRVDVSVRVPETRAQPEVSTPEVSKIKEQPERKPEALPAVDVSERPSRTSRPATTVSAAPVVQKKDALTEEIETILSDDLTDLFLKMTPSEQEAFRQKGEATASLIREMLQSAKVNIKKILGLIRDWLKLIPGVNRFFLEQEAKIKTDKILLAAEEHQQQGRF